LFVDQQRRGAPPLEHKRTLVKGKQLALKRLSFEETHPNELATRSLKPRCLRLIVVPRHSLGGLRLRGAWVRVAAPVRRAERDGETRFKLVTAALFYRLIRSITSVNIPQDTGDFRLLDRSVVDSLVTMREQHRFMRGLSAWVGFRQEAVPYHREERYAGTTKYPLQKMIRFSIDAITSFSHVPLQLATSFGFVLAAISLVGVLVAAILRVVFHHKNEGVIGVDAVEDFLNQQADRVIVIGNNQFRSIYAVNRGWRVSSGPGHPPFQCGRA